MASCSIDVLCECVRDLLNSCCAVGGIRPGGGMCGVPGPMTAGEPRTLVIGGSWTE